MFLQRRFSRRGHGIPRKTPAPIQRPLIMKFRCLIVISLTVLVLAGCSQNIEVVNSGERLEDSPKPVVDPNAAPLARAGAADKSEIPPFVKAYFMHMWVEALYSTPQNKHPNPNWKSPLEDPVNGRVWCTDCHVSGQIDFSKIPKIRNPMVDDFEKDKQFMAGLVEKEGGSEIRKKFGAK